MPNKTPPTATGSAPKPTSQTANGSTRARNAKATRSLPTAATAATRGTDLFGKASDCAHDASAAAVAPACFDPATEFELAAEFETFWQRYPRKRSKGFARRAWNTARKKASFEEIMAGLERYKFDTRPEFRPYPGTFLNGERWNDVEPDLAADPWGLNEYLTARAPLNWGWHVVALEEILTAAGLDRTWRGDLDTMAKWLTDGYRPDSIALVLAEETTKQPVPRFLAWLDRPVRARAFRWNENRLEWTRQRP